MAVSRRYGILWPSWTKSPKLSTSSRKGLISITKAFQTANDTIRAEAQRDLSKKNLPIGRTKSYFKDVDLVTLDRVKSLVIPELDGDFTGLQLALADTSYLPIWKAAVNSLLHYQGSHYDYLSWKFAKQEALDILEQRDVVAEIFEEIEDELRTQKSNVYDGIIAKAKMLERFTMIYDAQPSPVTMGDNPAPEPYYQLYPLESRKRKKIVVEAYSQMQQRVSCLNVHVEPWITH